MSGLKRADSLAIASRRELIRVGGGLAVFGFVLPGWRTKGRAAEGTSSSVPARSCILVYLLGGPPHIDMFDLKPQAPAEVRGSFRPIATNVPGIEIC